LGVIVGDETGTVAAALAASIAEQWPLPDAKRVQVDANPTRTTFFNPRESKVEHGLDTGAVIRHLLRQDIDALVVTALEDSAAAMLQQAAQTGHAVLLASNPRDAAALVQIGGGDDREFEFVIELRDGALHSVIWRGRLFAQVRGSGVFIDRSLLPKPLKPSTSQWPSTPPLAQRRAARVAARAAWLPVTSPTSTAHSRLGTSTLLRPTASTWPRCAQCEKPLHFVLQLDLAELPNEFALPVRERIVSLFLCRAVCDDGVHLEHLLPTSSLTMQTAPDALPEVTAPGAIADWRRFEEEPSYDDRNRLELPDAEGDSPRPLFADKLGGWPAWQQDTQWPSDEDGTPMTLLFQIHEDMRILRNSPPVWSFDEARLLPGTPATRTLDSDAPCHFPSLLTGEATAFIFIGKAGQLQFVWQTG
jgi:hypothetical protein